MLGDHVAQKGSLVAPDRLRFDFSHPKPMTAEEIAAVEAMANAIMLQNAPVETRLMAREEAMKSGAMALFGEKYGDEVRVVSHGHGDWPASKARQGLLGRAVRRHACRAAPATSASSRSSARARVAAGVRRIEALTGEGARKHLAEQDERVRASSAAVLQRPARRDRRPHRGADRGAASSSSAQLADARRRLAHGRRRRRDAATSASAKSAASSSWRAPSRASRRRTCAASSTTARSSSAPASSPSSACREDGKAGLVVGVTDDLTRTYNAVDLVRVGAEALGGKGGGGRPDMAQAGGPDGAKADAAVEAVLAAVKAKG